MKESLTATLLAGAALCAAVLAAAALGPPKPPPAAGGGTPGVTRESLLEAARLHTPLPLPGFPEPSSFCGGCHPLPPHSGEGTEPAFLNHHATVFECLVCHWARVSGERPLPLWDRGSILRLEDFSERGKEAVAEAREGVLRAQKCFDRGRGCASCHRPGGMEPYGRPGLAPQALGTMERLPEFLTLSPGAKWYFPQRP